jgi:hypothetical protein
MLSISISMDSVFDYAEAIVNALMPVVYVSAGIGLGFVIVGKIIGAFR